MRLLVSGHGWLGLDGMYKGDAGGADVCILQCVFAHLKEHMELKSSTIEVVCWIDGMYKGDAGGATVSRQALPGSLSAKVSQGHWAGEQHFL